MSRPKLIRIGEQSREVTKIGNASNWYVEYAGDFGDGKLWRTFGPEGGCATKEDAEAIKDNDQLLIDSWNARVAS